MWWIIAIAVIGFIVYLVNKDYKENVKTNVTNFGGMMVKYDLVIDYLKASGLALTRLTSDSVELSSKSATWNLDYAGTNLEVRMKAFVPLLGNISKKWTFPDNYPQEKMIEEFNNYADWQVTRIKKMAESDPLQYL